MDMLLKGIWYGLILTVLVGPLFITLIQTGVEEGFRAGFIVGLGIWISDTLYITLTYFGVAYISSYIDHPNFYYILGGLGSLLLIGFGAGALLSKPPSFDIPVHNRKRTSSIGNLWLKGFLINSVNPFTVFFWVGVMSTIVIDGNLKPDEAFLFFAGIVGTLVVTDSAKVALAKWIRKWIKSYHVLWLRRISGIALIGFGVFLMVRVLSM